MAAKQILAMQLLIAAFGIPAFAISFLPPGGEGTCEGACGLQSPFGCFCDDLCTFYGDCCPDAVELCLTFPPSPPTPPSLLTPPPDATCEGSCGGISPFGCFCDDLCTLFNDCCPDAVELCLTTPPSPPMPPSPPVTCEGSCGGISPFGCFCDDLCTLFLDCCPDAVELCLAIPPSPPMPPSPPSPPLPPSPPPSPPVTCEGSCGGQSPFGCFCDDLCTAFDDCCPDAVELCLPCPLGCLDNPIIFLTIPSHFTGVTSPALGNTIPGPPLGNGPDIFFTITPTMDVLVDLNTCGSTFNTVVGVLFASNLSVIASNDDAGSVGPCPGTTQSALVNIKLTVNVAYIIVVDGLDEDSFGAFKHQIIFSEVLPPPPSPPIFPLGDVNFDGVITVADVVIVSNSILGIAPLTGDAFNQADVNMDGAITVIDIILIINIILGI